MVIVNVNVIQLNKSGATSTTMMSIYYNSTSRGCPIGIPKNRGSSRTE